MSIQEQISRVDRAGNTPLHIAAQHSLPNHVRHLLELGANPNTKNRRGRTPLSLASDPDCRAFLIAALGHPPRFNVTILGNINNYPLLLAEGLRALGHEVKLVFNRPELLHRPESKYPELAGAYPPWMIDAKGCMDDAIYRLDPLVLRAALTAVDDADFVVLNDAWPSLAGYIDRPVVCLLTGSDLGYFANHRSIEQISASWDPAFKETVKARSYLQMYSRFVARQRTGILKAGLVSWPDKGLVEEGDELLAAIGVHDSRRIFMLISDTVTLSPAPPPDATDELRIFCGARIDYLQPADEPRNSQDLKGSDILIEGFAEYRRTGGKGRLRMVRKGHDIAHAEALIGDLGIADCVTWLKELSLQQFYDEIRNADLVCDQLGPSFPGMVTLDAYALGRPVLANFRNEIFKTRFGAPLPGLDATTPAQVAAQLAEAEADSVALRELGRKSRDFAEKYLSPRSVADRLSSQIPF
jgi:glycosyltransferase involved in cell wall biosynthesis